MGATSDEIKAVDGVAELFRVITDERSVRLCEGLPSIRLASAAWPTGSPA